MLKIREEQLETFSKSELRRFAVRAAAHLRERAPKRFVGKTGGEVEALVGAAVDDARARGIVSERDLVRLLELLVAVNGIGDFEGARRRFAWMDGILEDGWIPPGRKVEILRERAASEATEDEREVLAQLGRAAHE
jgi:hypothetical protein